MYMNISGVCLFIYIYIYYVYIYRYIIYIYNGLVAIPQYWYIIRDLAMAHVKHEFYPHNDSPKSGLLRML